MKQSSVILLKQFNYVGTKMVNTPKIAEFCKAAYSNQPEKHISGPWKTLLTTNEVHLSKFGFYAAVFVNEETKEVVIANRGTEISLTDPKGTLFDIFNDAQLYLGQTPIQFTYAADKFVDKVIEKLGNTATDYKFVTTGHSLGSVLATLESAKLATLGFYVVASVGIDNPGSKPILEHYIKGYGLNLDPQNLDIEVYNSPPNLINTCNPQIGKVTQLDMPEVNNTITALCSTSLGYYLGGGYLQSANATLVNHSLSNITQYIDKYSDADNSDCVLVTPMDVAQAA
jgi:hypothetical protein